jgi:hypothetical protein
MDQLALTPAALAETIALIEEGAISGKIAKDLLPQLLAGEANGGVRAYVEAKGLMQISGGAAASGGGGCGGAGIGSGAPTQRAGVSRLCCSPPSPSRAPASCQIFPCPRLPPPPTPSPSAAAPLPTCVAAPTPTPPAAPTHPADESAVEAMVDAVLAANPKQLADYRGGKTKLAGFFTGQVGDQRCAALRVDWDGPQICASGAMQPRGGRRRRGSPRGDPPPLWVPPRGLQVMKESGGRVNPGLMNQILMRKLNEGAQA